MRILKFGRMLAMLISLAGFAIAVDTGDKTIPIGVIAELTGAIPALGASCKNAAEMAVRQINNAGGQSL